MENTFFSQTFPETVSIISKYRNSPSCNITKQTTQKDFICLAKIGNMKVLVLKLILFYYYLLIDNIAYKYVCVGVFPSVYGSLGIYLKSVRHVYHAG